ncbi:MAG: glycosyltransferase family 4 protein [Lacunisphaera sp.]
MKLLVLAQTPPPLHGQSAMVRTMVDGLPAHGVALHHINLRLSYDQADIGRWRPGKVFAILGACARAVGARFRHGCDTLYYIPAPGKRGALYRDWLVMLVCRPFFRRLVLHWHASGLAGWLAVRATSAERMITGWLLGRADLSIVLAPALTADATALRARKIIAVANGIPDPDEPPARTATAGRPFQVFFLGLCSEEKGLFAAAHAVLAANRAAGTPAFTLVAAGAFPNAATDRRFRELCAQHPATLTYAGPVHGPDKVRLLRESDCLCLPTRYPAEGQPLVLLEAMAADLPIVATHWAGIPDTVRPARRWSNPETPARSRRRSSSCGKILRPRAHSAGTTSRISRPNDTSPPLPPRWPFPSADHPPSHQRQLGSRGVQDRAPFVPAARAQQRPGVARQAQPAAGRVLVRGEQLPAQLHPPRLPAVAARPAHQQAAQAAVVWQGVHVDPRPGMRVIDHEGRRYIRHRLDRVYLANRLKKACVLRSPQILLPARQHVAPVEEHIGVAQRRKQSRVAPVLRDRDLLFPAPAAGLKFQATQHQQRSVRTASSCWARTLPGRYSLSSSR